MEITTCMHKFAMMITIFHIKFFTVIQPFHKLKAVKRGTLKLACSC